MSSKVPSIIGSDIRLVGTLTSPGEVQLDGIIEGEVSCGHLTVGEHGVITGTVKADHLVLLGRIEGKVRAKTVNLEHMARIKGDVTYETLSMPAGVQVDGKLIPMSARDSKLETEDKGAVSKPKPISDMKSPQPNGRPII